MDFKKFSSIDSDQRVSKYAKDVRFESFLELLNQNLEGLNDHIKSSYNSEAFPSILLVSVPRSGSTLGMQILASRLKVGYVSNLMSRFYKTPLVGAMLQKNLIGDSIHQLRNYKSKHGQTNAVYEPNEFGYFWSDYLNFGKAYHEPENDIDRANTRISELEQVLNEVSMVYDMPVVYKCPLACFFMEEIMSQTSVFVIHLYRQPEDVIKSAIRVRKERLGSEDKWWSIRPLGYEAMLEKPPYEQVEWQYHKIESSITKGLSSYEDRTYKCSYETLIEKPEFILDEIIEKYRGYCGKKMEKIGDPILKI